MGCDCQVDESNEVLTDADLQPCGANALDPKSDIARAVAALTVDPYAAFAGYLAQSYDQRDAARAHELLDSRMRSRLDAATDGEKCSAKAVYLQWIERFAEIFLPPILLADVLLKRSPLLGLIDWNYRRCRWVAEGLQNIGPRRYLPQQGILRFEKLVFHHLSPFANLWGERTGIPARVIWVSVSARFEKLIDMIESISGSTKRLVEIRDLLCVPSWPDGRANLLFRIRDS